LIPLPTSSSLTREAPVGRLKDFVARPNLEDFSTRSDQETHSDRRIMQEHL